MARKRGHIPVHLSHAQMHQVHAVISARTTIAVSVRKKSLPERIADYGTSVKRELLATIRYMIDITPEFDRAALNSPRPR